MSWISMCVIIEDRNKLEPYFEYKWELDESFKNIISWCFQGYINSVVKACRLRYILNIRCKDFKRINDEAHKMTCCTMLRTLSWNYLWFIGVCIVIHVSVNYYWTKVTSSVFMLLVFRYLNKTVNCFHSKSYYSHLFWMKRWRTSKFLNNGLK